MTIKKELIAASGFLLLMFVFAAPPANAQGKKVNEYKSIVKHLKTRYKAKKVSIPMMWLARAAVKVARPVGVQSFSLTMFENLQFTSATLDAEMQSMMKNSFGVDWSSVYHGSSREGQQIYMYMRDEGKSINMTLVTINKNQAAVIRARFHPDKFIEFINDPKIFGISIGDDNPQAISRTAAPNEISASESKGHSGTKGKKEP
ncbi:MAG TPA: hypothetical protein VNI60_02535 [Pyrinomonadaceae bacterium]|nr:hypothetical protein [Pyrinomonadaceae bacterium]